jgi:hypothetical protein|tara:strand:+ start:1835 stop:2098 length:264 start_codon:yes stop_codon:yes gene_type:complete
MSTIVDILYWIQTSESEPNKTAETADKADFFSIRKEDLDRDRVAQIATYLNYKGEVRESESGQSWLVFKSAGSQQFDLSCLPSPVSA